MPLFAALDRLKAELDAVNQLNFGHYCEKLLHFREQREGV